MAGFIEGVSRDQATLFPERLDDWVTEDNLARVVDIFVAELDLATLGFHRHAAARTGRPGSASEAVHLWLSEPDPVQPVAGAGGRA